MAMKLSMASENGGGIGQIRRDNVVDCQSALNGHGSLGDLFAHITQPHTLKAEDLPGFFFGYQFADQNLASHEQGLVRARCDNRDDVGAAQFQCRRFRESGGAGCEVENLADSCSYGARERHGIAPDGILSRHTALQIG